MVRKIVGGILILISAVLLVTEIPAGNMEPIAPAVIFIIIGLVLLIRKHVPRAEKAARKAEQEHYLGGKHIAGLSLAEGTYTGLQFLEDKIEISGGGNTFSLPYSRITDLSIKTEAESQTAYVSSAGGAMAGGMLFGPAGAMIGGRTKEKTTLRVDYFFIITYKKDGTLDYLVFRDIPSRRARKLIEETKPKWGAGERIEL